MFLQKSFILDEKVGCHLVTSKILKPLSSILNKVKCGLLHLSLSNSSASISINENADPTVRPDLMNAMLRMVSDKVHDSPAAARSLLFGSDIMLPITSGSLDLGTWQGIYLCVWEKGDCEVVATVQELRSLSCRSQVTITAPERGCHVVTDQLNQALNPGEAMHAQLCSLLIKHTSAAICVNATSPKLGHMMEATLNAVVPEKWNNEFFVHTYEGPDDMPGHCKSSLVGASLTVPVATGKLLSGSAQQGVYLCEHRDVGGWGGGHNRKVTLSLQPCLRQGVVVLPVCASSQSQTISAEELEKKFEIDKVSIGLCSLFCQHAHTSLVVCDEKFDGVAAMTTVLTTAAGSGALKALGSGVIPMLGGSSITVPITQGKLVLGPNRVFKALFFNGVTDSTPVEVVVSVQGNEYQ